MSEFDDNFDAVAMAHFLIFLCINFLYRSFEFCFFAYLITFIVLIPLQFLNVFLLRKKYYGLYAEIREILCIYICSLLLLFFFINLDGGNVLSSNIVVGIVSSALCYCNVLFFRRIFKGKAT